MFERALLPTVFLLSALALPARGQDPEPAHRLAASEEAPLRMRYLPWLDALMLAVYKDGVFYLPASELLRRLGIANELQHSKQRLVGFYLRKEMRYSIDVSARVATLGNRSVELRNGEGWLGELDVYLAPAVLERLFGWRIVVDLQALEVRIASSELLPIATVALGSRSSTAQPLPDTSGAVRFARRRHLLYGGALDYVLYAENSSENVRRSVDLLIGGEIVGGDFQARLLGDDLPGSRAPLSPKELRWRYVRENSAVLSQVAIGDVFSSAPGGVAVRGVQITNQPIETRARFATHVLQGTTGSEWDVEVYVNERMVARTSADPLGRYRVEIPIGYGSASMRLRYLGPGGQMREETSRVEVPFTFLPPRQAAYVLTVGEQQNSQGRSAHAEIGVGVSPWLTARSGVQYREMGAAPDSRLAYHTLSARVGANKMLGATFSPGALARLSGEWIFASRAHLSATAARYGDDPQLNPSQLAWEWDGTSSIPMRVASVPLTLRFAGGERANEAGARTKRADGEAIFGIGPWLPSVGYRYGWAAPHGEIRTTSLLFLGYRLPRPLRNGVVRASLARPARTSDVGGHVEIGVLSQLAARQRLDLAYRYVRETRASQLEVRLQLETRSGRATTTHRQEAGRAFWSQSVAGSVAVDPNRTRVTMSGRPLVGRGGVSVRFFLDENGNGRFDPTELPVSGATARFDRVAEVRTTQPGEMLVTELLPYHRYYGQIDSRSVPNPLWRPQFRAFSLVADPNRFQAIEVPFYAAATAQGTVTRRGDDGERAVPGLKVHVMSAEGSVFELPTFADGSFYHQGLPRGRYIVRPDSAQLEILAVTSNPSERIFEVRPSREGSSIEGLDFVLLPRRPRP